MGNSRRRMAFGWLFYCGLALLLGLILLQLLADILPATLARRLGYNSEGYLVTLVIAAWIQFARPRLTERSRWPVTAVAAATCLVIGLALLQSDLPSRFKTLNEPMIALGMVLPYLTLRRALPRMVLAVPALILLGVVVGLAADPDGLVINLAETFGYWALVPIVFDLTDKGILDPDAETSTALRYPTYAILTLVPVTVSALGVAERDGGGIHAWLSYLGRIHESFIGVLLPAVYFAVLLGRTGVQRHRDLDREAIAAR